jgi:hypothetical protein
MNEPCVVCGEETAIGSVFFSDRHTVEKSDGTRTYLCGLCNARVRSAGKGKKGKPLTDEELRSLVENGSLAAIAWSGGA